MFKFRNPFELTDQGKIWFCEKFHKKHHEKYRDYLGDYGGYVGEQWDEGIRCNKCGRKWADPEIVKYYEEQQRREYQEKLETYYHCHVGTADYLIFELDGEWGKPESLLEEYNELSEVYKQLTEPEDHGSIEDKYFAFICDLQELPKKVIIEEQKWCPYTRECDLLCNYPGIIRPMHPEAKKVWDKRKLTFEEAKERILNGYYNGKR